MSKISVECLSVDRLVDRSAITRPVVSHFALRDFTRSRRGLGRRGGRIKEVRFASLVRRVSCRFISDRS
jgi:hypothetical protein